MDPAAESQLDVGVDAHISRIAGTNVPMLRVQDSFAIAEHAAALGLIDPASIAGIADEVRRDARRPTEGEAAVEEAKDAVLDGNTKD